MQPTSKTVKTINPITHPLSYRVSVPGSKSHTNRALLLASLADESTTLENALFSEDSGYFSKALTDLGFKVQSSPSTGTITVQGLGGDIPVESGELFIGNAGTAARFLTALLTLGYGEFKLDGVERMRQRPIGDLVTALNNLGARIKATSKEPGLPNHSHGNNVDDRFKRTSSSPTMHYPPVSIQACGLIGGRTSIRGDISSQFLSAVLMVSPYAEGPVEIAVDGHLHSKPYIDLTLDVMADFGVEVHRTGYSTFSIVPQVYRSPGLYPIESDASAASYFFAAPAVCSGWVEVSDISRSSRQGDIAFLDILTEMGCTISEKENSIRAIGTQHLRGVDVDMGNISDTFMTLAAIAPFASTPTTIRGIGSSRLKETDRIAATCTELRRLGVEVDERPDGMTIYPCNHIQPARIHTYDDHRIAMAFSLVGLRISGIEINNPDCVAKTFPNFFEVLQAAAQ